MSQSTLTSFSTDTLSPSSSTAHAPRRSSPVSFYGMSVFKIYYARFICVFLLLATPFSKHAGVNFASAAAPTSNLNECVGNYEENVDYFPNKITVDNATLFGITYSKNYKLLTNKYTKETFALYQCGTPAPSTGLPDGTKLFSVPVKSVAVLDTSSNTYLEMLGLRSSITLLDSSADVSSPCIQSMKQSSIGTLSTNETLRGESLSKVDLAIGAYIADNKTKNSVSTSAPLDPGTLQRVEWLKFYSTFFNLEERAQNLVSQINGNYACLKRLANPKPSDLKPLVAWVAYDAPANYNNNTASWSIVDAVFKKQLTEDAGGTYLNTSSNFFSTSASFLKAIENVDILIDETYLANNLSDVLSNFGVSSSDEKYKFVKDKKIYREDGLKNPSDGRDWLESGIPMQDAVLEDVINIVNPKLPLPNYQRVWLRNVATGETPKIVSSKNCTDPNAALPDRASNCLNIKSAGASSIKSTTFTAIVVALVASLFGGMIL